MTLTGTFACPICDKDTPHFHSDPVVQDYRESQRASDHILLRCGCGQKSWAERRHIFNANGAREEVPHLLCPACAKPFSDKTEMLGNYGNNYHAVNTDD